MPLTADVVDLGENARSFLKQHFVEFLETKHSLKVKRKLSHKIADERLKPVEAFEVDIKDKLSNAAHEILHAIDKLHESKRARVAVEMKNFLRYAKANLDEAGKDIEAAERVYYALQTYCGRVEQNSTVLGHELRYVQDELFSKIEQLRAFQRTLLEKTTVLINQVAT